MALNDALFLVPSLGRIYTAPSGTAAPDASALASPLTPWTEIGHIGGGDKGKPDGLPTWKSDGGDQTPLGSWAKQTVRTIVEALTDTVEFSISQFDDNALKLYTNADGGDTAGQFQVFGTEVGQGYATALLIVLNDSQYQTRVGFWAPYTTITRADDIELGAQDPTLIPVAATLLDHTDADTGETSPRYAWVASHLNSASGS